LISKKQVYEKILNSENLKIPTIEKDIRCNNKDKIYSGVLVIIHFPANVPSILLTKRSIYLKNHAGEISFPGGKFYFADKTILDTAIRETYEEIGIRINKKQISGCLTPIFTYTSKILIYPFIAIEEKMFDKFQSNSAEVEQIINLPLEKLMTSISEDIYHLNKNFKMFKFIVDDYIIWGATASILKELIDQLNS
jgi:8-oxo-dGTP pyrophosphatase MutT (NUDIX family)